MYIESKNEKAQKNIWHLNVMLQDVQTESPYPGAQRWKIMIHHNFIWKRPTNY